ncbi:MAG: hypothetical protein F6K41_21845 [Symploca sp. SIO3E6]|nr:hypothetical protein [Caldora sp. SIO3E6]
MSSESQENEENGLQNALVNWKKKRAKFERELSITADPQQKFELPDRIKECKEHIQRLELEILIEERKIPSLGAKPRKDISRLLSGQELKDAINLLKNNGIEIGDFNRNFFIKSLVWDTQRPKKKVFSQCWVGNEALLKPPYSKAMKAWSDSQAQKNKSLLHGYLLQGTIDWAGGNSLSEGDRDFIIDSLVGDMDKYKTSSKNEKEYVYETLKIFWTKLENKCDNPYKVAQEILSWTECQPFFTEKICRIISNNESKINQGEEKEKTALIVETYFNQDSEDQEIASHLDRIYSLLIDNKNHDSFWLLFSYRKILKEQEIEKIVINDKIKASLNLLQESGLVVNQHSKLQIHNCIYQSIFNEDWLEKHILYSRPDPQYAKKFLNWLDSNCQDNTQLLNQQETQEAIKWAQENGNKLTSQEHKFISFSFLL